MLSSCPWHHVKLSRASGVGRCFRETLSIHGVNGTQVVSVHRSVFGKSQRVHDRASLIGLLHEFVEVNGYVPKSHEWRVHYPATHKHICFLWPSDEGWGSSHTAFLAEGGYTQNRPHGNQGILANGGDWCAEGHPFTPENTVTRHNANGPYRACRKCRWRSASVSRYNLRDTPENREILYGIYDVKILATYALNVVDPGGPGVDGPRLKGAPNET